MAAGETFFSATAVPHALRQRLTQDVDAGVCIVGGGFAGLWTAWSLARRGYEVALIDAGTVAGEASGRNAGFVSAGYADRPERLVDRVGIDQARSLYALSRRGMDIVSGVLAEGISGVDPVPGRLHVRRFDDADGARRQADYFAEHFGHEMLVWPTERVRETLQSERYYQALHDADAFSVHPLNLALALAAEIEAHGGRIFEQTTALGADLEGVRKRVVTEGGRVRAAEVVFCGSAFIGRGFPNLQRTILPVSSYMCATAPLGEALEDAIRYAGAITDTRRAGDYFRVIDGRLLWGGGISTRTAPPRGLKRKLARDIARVFPTLKGVEVERAWTGVMGHTVHRMPQIGMLKPGVWIASGFGGHGLNTTALAGELISTAIVDHDDRWRQFVPFGLVWAGGAVGRRLMQAVHWETQVREKLAEFRSRRTELRAKRRAAYEAARKAVEEKERQEKEALQKQRDAEELKKLLAREEEEEKRRQAEDTKEAVVEEET